jgi:predicted NAD/FAD-binding protein
VFRIAAPERNVSVMQPVRSVKIVSDGVVIEFADGVTAYFAADFLSQHIGRGTNHILLSYDPSPEDDYLPAACFPIC